MTRVSQLELYNDKDVITQILLMKEQVETGTYAEVRITEDSGNYVFEFEDQKGDVQTFTVPAKQISGVTSSQSGSTVTMRINYNDGTHTDLTWTAGGDVTTNTNQTISAVKTFTASPIIPSTPSGPQAAVNVTYVSKTDGSNNLVHTSADESISGIKTFNNRCNLDREVRQSGMYEKAQGATPTGNWREVATFSGNVRGLVLALSKQSERLSLFYIKGGNSPTASVLMKKSYPADHIAINHDGAGNCVLLMKTGYVYQPPCCFPIWTTLNDISNSSGITWGNGTEYGPDLSQETLPYANVVYGTMIGVDVS